MNRRGNFGYALMGAGWLFADLLLALAMVFLASSTFPIKPPVTPTPPPPTVVVHPTPTPIPPLDVLNKQTIVVHHVDYVSLTVAHPSPEAIAILAGQIKEAVNRDHLQKRRAGLAIAYGVAANNNQQNEAVGVADEVYNALSLLAEQKFLFFRDAKHYGSLFTLKLTADCNDLSCIKIDVYLFTQ